MKEPSPGGQPQKPRRGVVAAVGATVVAIVAAGGFYVVQSGDTSTPRALSAASDTFVAPCTDATEACQNRRLDALEAWASKDNPTPTETPSPTPTTTSATPTPTATVTPTPTPTSTSPTPTPTVTPPPTKALLGMSAPNGEWNQRVSEVGPGLQARRLFFNSFSSSLSLATTACNAGMTPIISYKTGSYTWAQVGSGAADADLRAAATRINALPCASFVAIHHEPSSDGTASDYTKMQVHALPILGGALGGKVKVGPILNGWFFNTNSQGLSDAELDQWAGPSVRAVSDFVASDTYQGTTTAEGVASKIKRMGAWARRVNAATPAQPVRALGQGEWNVQSAQGVTDACNAIAAEPLEAFSAIWNNDGTGSANAHVLTGAMLTAFRSCLANW